MNNNWAIITGGGSGIGRALAVRLAKLSFPVLVVGRTLKKLEQTAQQAPRFITPLKSDVSTTQGREAIKAFMERNGNVRFLVHNAAVLEPVKPLSQITLQEWRTHMAINVEGPLFLTQTLLPLLKKNARILHISSGAAHAPYAGWGAYCTSKAALYMIYQILKQELAASAVLVGSVRPGVVNTPMQDKVRTANPNYFPRLEKFLRLYHENQLIPPEKVAHFIAHLLLNVSAEQFQEKEWDIREHPEFL